MSSGTPCLVGRTVIAPARLWPDMAPPKGMSGWEGTISGVRSKDPEQFWVRFPGDPSRYFFEGKDVRSWLVPGKEGDKPESSKQAAKKRAAAEERVSPAKKKQSEEKVSPAKKKQSEEKVSPQKKKKQLEQKPSRSSSPQKKSPVQPIPAGLKVPLPPKPSPAKPVTKEAALAELEPLLLVMNASQVMQIVEASKKVLS